MSRTVADEIASLADLLSDQRHDANYFKARWLARRTPSHQAIAAEAGVSRETVRLTLHRLAVRAQALRPNTPILDDLAQQLEHIGTTPLRSADQRLADLLGPTVSLLSVKRFAREVLGRDIPLPLSGRSKALRIVGTDAALRRALVRSAHAAVERFGAIRLTALHTMARRVDRRQVPLEALLALLDDVMWLDGSRSRPPARHLQNRRFGVSSDDVPPLAVLAREVGFRRT